MPHIYEIEYGCVNIKGGVRDSNQDNFYVRGKYRFGSEKLNDLAYFGSFKSTENSIVSVYDGMGGEACGDMASLIAASGTASFDGIKGNFDEIVSELFSALNDLVCEYAASNDIDSMGSTAAVIRFSEDTICCGNLGDSRIYRINDKIEQLSEDHNIKNFYSRKSPLTQYLGLPTDELVLVPSIIHEEYVMDDNYLICSDGITDMLTDSEIFVIINQSDTVKEATMNLVSAALKRGGVDNITAIICKIKG